MTMRRRSLPEQLQYLAEKLRARPDDPETAIAVAIALDFITEDVAPGWQPCPPGHQSEGR